MGHTRILLSALIPILLLPLCTTLVLLIIRPFVQFSVSCFQLLAQAHFTWLPDSPFLDHGPLVPSPCDAIPFASQCDTEVERLECVFCLCDIVEGEGIRELRCKHLFHRSCLNRWLEFGRATCPLCRDSLAPLKPSDKLTEMDYMGLDALEVEWQHMLSADDAWIWSWDHRYNNSGSLYHLPVD